jgi:hypothetical protein
MGNHLIHRQVLELRYAEERRAKTAMDQWGERYRKEWLPIIEEVLDELDQNGNWYRVQKVELDLGRIREDQSPENLRQKLKESLKNQLLHQIPELQKERFTQTEVNPLRPQDDLKPIELLIYQLSNGRKPWWASISKKDGIRSLVKRFLAEKNNSFLAWLQSESFSQEIFERLANHIGYSEIQTIISLAFPEKQEESQTLIQSLVLSLSPEISPKTELQNLLENQTAESFLIPEKLLKNPVSQWFKTWLFRPKTAFQPTQEALLELWVLLIPASFFEKPQLSNLEKIWSKWVSSPIFSAAVKSKSSPPFSKVAWKEQFMELVKNGKALNKASVNQELQNGQSRKSATERLKLDETFPISNSGLVLVAPFLPYFFKGLGLVENKEFVSKAAQNRGVLLLQALLDDSYFYEESDLLLNKILCGIDVLEPIEVNFSPTETEKEEIHNLLDAMVARWTALKSTSGASMSKGFFAREGSLKRMDKGYQLTIPRISIDILLNRLPWTISIIKLPWMEETLYTEW